MFFGLFPIVKALILLVVSFFLLLSASIAKSKGLQQFGRILAITLCIIAAYLIIFSTYSSLTGKPCEYKKVPHKKMHHGMMRQKQPSKVIPPSSGLLRIEPSCLELPSTEPSSPELPNPEGF